MVEKQEHEDDDKTLPPAKTVAILLGTAADTTWRLFLPSIGGTLLGLWADKSWDTTPWLTATGVVLGSVIAGYLVYNQIKNVKS